MAPDSEYPSDKSLLQAVELAAVENEIQVKGMNVESQLLSTVYRRRKQDHVIQSLHRGRQEA